LGEQVKFKDTFSNIWSTHEVDLEDFSLEMTLICSVSLQSIEQKGGAFLDLVELQESVNNLINISFWWTLVSVSDHLSETNSCLWVHWHDLSQNLNEIWNMASLLAVWHDFIELVSFNKTLNNLIW
jgi:hypothetical protein